jgi:RHS repeat-associated protein
VPATARYNANNQVTWTTVNSAVNGFTYDPSGNGNVVNDNLNQYLYDAEGRICAVSSTPMPGDTRMIGYLYNAEGVRVAKGNITTLSCNLSINNFQLTESYVLGQGGEELTTINQSGAWWTNVYGAGKLLATYDPIGLHFHLTDPLGTRRLQTSSVGQPETDIQSLPFGNQLNSFSDQSAPGTADDSTPLHFTGKERDSESGNDYFGARYYGSSMGRWTSPDPLPWPHWQNGSDDDKKQFQQFIMNSQNLNAYTYVLNNPLTSIDPNGLQVYVVAYTTGNSEGDDALKRAAQTKADEITSSKGFDPKKDAVVIGGVKTKEDFQNLLTAAAGIQDQFGKTSSVSLFSHSGDLDGPVFHDANGHASQMSGSDMANLKVNWSDGATASFYGCNSGVNFTQNFANAQHVKSLGYLGGVDFSGNPNTVSKWYVLTGQWTRYMVDKGERGLQEKDPK